MKMTRLGGALALALLLGAPVASEVMVGAQITKPAGYIPAQAIYCDDGTGHAALCSFGGGNDTSSETSASIVIATANTAATVIPAPTSGTIRKGYRLQNQSGDDCWVIEGATAAEDQTSLKVADGQLLTTEPGHVDQRAVSIICKAANARIFARSW